MCTAAYKWKMVDFMRDILDWGRGRISGEKVNKDESRKVPSDDVFSKLLER